jgi:hypothetical protein
MEDAFLESQVDEFCHSLTSTAEGRVTIPLHEYRGMSSALRLRLLRRAYISVKGDARGLTLVHLETMDRLAQQGGEEKWLHFPGGVHGVVSGGALVIGRSEVLEAGKMHYPVICPGANRVPEANLQIRW